MIWMAFHFRDSCANWLTNPAFDPISATAEYKACAVRIERINGAEGPGPKVESPKVQAESRRFSQSSKAEG
jgi:predicted molibdopterin-dependent oxidoreductase YjgC